MELKGTLRTRTKVSSTVVRLRFSARNIHVYLETRRQLFSKKLRLYFLYKYLHMYVYFTSTYGEKFRFERYRCRIKIQVKI